MSTQVEAVMEVLDTHRWKSMGATTVRCECGEVVADQGPPLTRFPADEAFRRHVAQAVVAALA